MARRRGEAWVTTVANDDAVSTALVLAASLRMTRTTRNISVIMSPVVSKESRKILRQGFDAAFLWDDSLVEGGTGKNGTNESSRAKIFAFSLEIYEKCIFLPPTTIALENCDNLFDCSQAKDWTIKNLSGDMDMFLFTPSLALCEYLEETRKTWHSEVTGELLLNSVCAWRKNNKPNRTYDLTQDSGEWGIGAFSVKNGRLLMSKGHSHLKIVTFVDISDDDAELGITLKKFVDSASAGLMEKRIVMEWLQIYEQQVASRPFLDWNALKQSNYDNEPIAIVGMSCRFPGASNLEEFWNLLYYGKEGICVPPKFRWTKEQSVIGGSRERETYAGFLTVPVDEFDAKFFGISPKEVEFLDPQARLLQEVMWEGLEHGGINPHSLRGTHTGIFTGSWLNDYKDIVQTSVQGEFFRTYMGSGMGATAARLSFLLGLTGPSIATESGCSSAIVAVDLAIKSLRNGESNLAIAGGVNLLLHPFQGSLNEYFISPDGRCKTFDEKANGFGRAEGCGVLVLKRFSDALRDRDHIWAIVRGSAISQEGMSRSMGTPTVHCEALAMELALSNAGVRPEEVTFVETHGTGTAVGDPMEVAAITKVYHSNARKDPLIIGSVKTNVGHTESCSGITGIIKTVLAMQHEVIPKHLNLDTLNPNINLDAIPAKIPLEPIPWPKVQGHPRIAGVSSFGITGTDGHVIIEETPDYTLPKFTLSLERPVHLIKFSAKTKEALDDTKNSYADLFKDGGLILKDIAYSANTGRASFNHRAFLLAENCEEAATGLSSDKLIHGDTSGKELGKICFLFTGQGSQYEGMGKMLYETSPVFQLHFDQCDNVLRRQYNLSLRETLWESDGKSKELSRTIYSQTSIFCVEYCLLKLWESWGIKPDFVLGHSLGEFCAAVAAGILTFEDALMLVAERSRLIDALPRGNMLVIKSSQPEVEKIMKNNKIDLDYAAVNSSDQTVVAGDPTRILELLNVCKSTGLKAVVLEATHAFHSRHMDPMLTEYQKIAGAVKHVITGKCQYISGVRGHLLENLDSEMNADYWVDHTREKVSFLEACNSLKQLNCQHFVEIGPQPVLSTFVLQNIDNQPVSCYPSLRRNTNDWETILTSLGKLYLNGVNVDWEGYDRPYDRKKVSSHLPFHPFHRKSFWTDCSTSRSVTIHPLVGSPLTNASALNIFQNKLNLKSVPFIKDHCIGERIIMPGAAFAEMCLSAGHCVTNSFTETLERPTRPVALENLTIEAPLAVTEEKPCRLQVIVELIENPVIDPDENSVQRGFRVKIFQQTHLDSDSLGKWQLHASSTFHPVVAVQDVMSKWNANRVTDLMSSSEGLSTLNFYKRIEGVGLKFSDAFKSIQRYWVDPGENKMDEIVAEVQLPSDHDNYLLHPIVTDAMIQTAVLSSLQTQTEVLMVPTGIGKLVWLGDPAGPSSTLYIHTRREDDNYFIFAADETLTPIAFLTDVQLTETNVKTIESILEQQNNPLPDSWEETWRPIPGPLDNQSKLPNLEPVFNSAESEERIQKVSAVVPEDWEHRRKMKRLIFLYQVKALLTLGWEPLKGERIEVREFCERHGILSKYHQLLHHYFSVCHDENGMMTFLEEEDLWQVASVPPPEGELEVEIAELNATLKGEEKVAVFSNIFRIVGEWLPKLLTGEESALQLLFPTEAPQQTECSADLFYRNHPGIPELGGNLTEILKVIAEQFRQENEDNPKAKLRVLEFGAGTGSLTQLALTALSTHFGGEFEYYYTDISGYFFPKAEKKFADFKKQLKFCVFDIEKGGLSQGIPVAYFDLVLGLEVLHATENLEVSLGNLRQIMRPGGTLCFTETIVQDRAATFVFGLLEGYWRFKDFHWRPRHACLGKDTWRRVLHQSGYDFTHATGVYMDTMGIFVSNASKSNMLSAAGRSRPTPQSKWVIFGGSDDLHGDLIERLSRCGSIKVTLVLSSRHGTGATWSDTADIQRVDLDSAELADQIKSILEEVLPQGIVYSWGVDIDTRDQAKIARPFLHLAKIALTLKPVPKVFVCTRGVHPVGGEGYVYCNPSAATLFGMVKSLKNENSDMLVRCIDLGDDSSREVSVNQILYELAMHKTARERDAVAVAYREGQRYEPIFSRANLQKKGGEELKLPPCTDRYQLVLPTSKMIQDLQYDALLETSVGDFEVEVKTKAYALNFKDVLTILKPTEEFQNYNGVGIDFAGVVTKVGKGVPQEKVKIGDRVFGVNTKDVPLSSHLIVDAAYVIKIPEGMTYAEAATLPAVFATSILCLEDVAQMKKGETVLIHTGSGGVGLAAIQLSRNSEVHIITTAGNPRKRAYLKSLGTEHVFHSRDTSYREEILKITQGKGVDIVLNSITGPGFKEATLDVLAKNGRFVEMSKLGAWSAEEVRRRRPDVRYSIVDLTDKTQISWDNLIERLRGYLQEGNIHPIPYVKFDALLLRQALQFLQKAKHIGKVVVTMPEVKTVEGQWKVSVPLFNADSTYLITGGLGGIGFEVCKWMLERGATNIVLIGRGPPKTEIAQGIAHLNTSNKGYKVTVKQGDIGNWEECKAILDEITENCGDKPLRGIHHCAGVLRDSLYPNQTWELFEATFNPKVEGTWNLHHLTRYLPLEHFVLYSSMSALFGTPGQSNHAAANCFEDAFAHYRYSLGLPATAINWGQWSQVGSAKDISLTGVLPVSVKRMLNGLEVTLRQQLTQVCFGEFESFHLMTVLCPTFTHYLDKRLRQTLHSESTQVHLKSDQFWKEVEEAEEKPQKLEVVTLYMKAILRGALRMEADEALDENANMQDLGVDSLMLIELKNSIQGLMGSRLNVTNTMLKDCHTVKDLSTVIVNKLCDEEEAPADAPPLSPEEYSKLLEVDSILEESIRPTRTTTERATVIKNVLITGATGKLGPYILSKLCEPAYETVEKIVCLIRTEGDRYPTEKLQKILESLNLASGVDMPKVECIRGDVTQLQFGLSEEDYQNLAESVDAVIHLAAKVDHAEPYLKWEGKTSDIRSVNVEGTLNILRFSVAGKTKRVYYASSIMSVFGGKEDDHLCDNWPEREEIKSVVEKKVPGYPASKFVCEMLLKQANERGIPCKVFRFPFIIGESFTGANYLDNHYILRFLSYLKMKVMPTAANPVVVLPVETCADWSLKLFLNEGAPDEIYNMVHPHPQLEMEFVGVAKECFGIELELVEWNGVQLGENLMALDAPESLKEFNDTVTRMIPGVGKYAFRAIEGYLDAPPNFFSGKKVGKYLPGQLQKIPPTMDILRQNLLHLKAKGFFAEFGI